MGGKQHRNGKRHSHFDNSNNKIQSNSNTNNGRSKNKQDTLDSFYTDNTQNINDNGNDNANNRITMEMIEQRRQQVESGSIQVPGVKSKPRKSRKKQNTMSTGKVIVSSTGVGGIAARVRERRGIQRENTDHKSMSDEKRLQVKSSAMSSYDQQMLAASREIIESIEDNNGNR